MFFDEEAGEEVAREWYRSPAHFDDVYVAMLSLYEVSVGASAVAAPSSVVREVIHAPLHIIQDDLLVNHIVHTSLASH